MLLVKNITTLFSSRSDRTGRYNLFNTNFMQKRQQNDLTEMQTSTYSGGLKLQLEIFIMLKAELINPFLNATKNVIETMAQTRIKAGKPYLKDDKLAFGEVTGVIGMSSETTSGTMIVSFSAPAILKIVANMLMEPLRPAIDDEVVDAVGEITNMICGGAKAELAKINHNFDLATPTMLVGKGVEIPYYSSTPTIVIPFATEEGGFVVEANLGTC